MCCTPIFYSKDIKPKTYPTNISVDGLHHANVDALASTGVCLQHKVRVRVYAGCPLCQANRDTLVKGARQPNLPSVS